MFICQYLWEYNKQSISELIQDEIWVLGATLLKIESAKLPILSRNLPYKFPACYSMRHTILSYKCRSRYASSILFSIVGLSLSVCAFSLLRRHRFDATVLFYTWKAASPWCRQPPRKSSRESISAFSSSVSMGGCSVGNGCTTETFWKHSRMVCRTISATEELIGSK